MSHTLAQRAERIKLARLLDVDPAQLRMIDALDAEALSALRARATTVFYAGDAPLFKRVVAASRLLPVPALALISESVLGPLLCGRVAGLMDVARGAAIAAKLKTTFLADVCLSLDPLQSRALIQAIPVPRVVDVAQVLAARGEHVTMGRFVDIVSDDAIRAVLDQLSNNADLLRIAFFAENKQRLDQIIRLLPQARLEAIIRTAASSDDLWPEALGLMQHLGAQARQYLGDLAASLEQDVLISMVQSISANGLWGDALPIVVSMSELSQARLANLEIVQSEAMLGEILDAASRFSLWPQLLPLVRLMDDDGKARCARVAEHLDGEQLLAIADIAASHALWPDLLSLLQRMTPARRDETVALIGIAPARVLDSLIEALEHSQSWTLLHQAWPQMNSGARQRLSAAAEAQNLGARLENNAQIQTPTAVPLPANTAQINPQADPAGAVVVAVTPTAMATTVTSVGAAVAVAGADYSPQFKLMQRQFNSIGEQLDNLGTLAERWLADQLTQTQNLDDLSQKLARAEQRIEKLQGSIAVLSLVTIASGLILIAVMAVIAAKFWGA